MNTDSPKVILLGAGGHARTLLGVLRRLDVSVLGMTSCDPREAGQIRNGVKILGGDDAITQWRPAEVLLVNGVGGADSTTHLRQRLFSKFKGLGYDFFSSKDPSALVDASSRLDEGTQIQMGAIIQTGVRIGLNAIVNTGSVVEHDCIVGDHCHIAPGVVLCGAVELGAGCFVGAGTVIRQGTKVGEGATIGAGSLVVKDVPPMTLSFGHPARVVRSL